MKQMIAKQILVLTVAVMVNGWSGDVHANESEIGLLATNVTYAFDDAYNIGIRPVHYSRRHHRGYRSYRPHQRRYSFRGYHRPYRGYTRRGFRSGRQVRPHGFYHGRRSRRH